MLKFLVGSVLMSAICFAMHQKENSLMDGGKDGLMSACVKK